MKTRDKILDLLESRKGEYISGEELASELSVTRAAVWKAVTGLREDGYPINEVQNNGYLLAEVTDYLTEQGIWKYLDRSCSMLNIRVLPETGSTNDLLRERSDAGCPEGTVLIAGMQTDGKGRLGRRFYSPANTGIYMSLLLRPDGSASFQTAFLTAAAAVAVCEAIPWRSPMTTARRSNPCPEERHRSSGPTIFSWIGRKSAGFWQKIQSVRDPERWSG